MGEKRDRSRFIVQRYNIVFYIFPSDELSICRMTIFLSDRKIVKLFYYYLLFFVLFKF